ncbi:MAG TPA: hypothetical protein VKW08_03300 [Xanthobacteraceae bacterium]|nr:hypothetical protein [Xanthobacteraceae bacterium]
MIIPEPSFAVLLTHGLALIGLIVLYFFGVWLRTYVLPADPKWPLRRQLAAAIPVGFVTMGLYGKTAIPPLFVGNADVFADVAVMVGYTIIFGMMSREALEKLIKAGPNVPGLPDVQGGGGKKGGGKKRD